MAAINIRSAIQTSKRIIPMIYAYSTPDIPKHVGWVKIGYTEAQDVEDRIKQQTHTADVDYVLEWQDNAIFPDGKGTVFHDTDFHNYLQKKNVERKTGTEWFHADGPTSEQLFYEFRKNKGLIQSKSGVIPYSLRKEQQDAVDQTVEYFDHHYEVSNSSHGEMLWNAKPRFGKTLTVYDFIKRIGAKNVLIVTNRPAIANSWYDDYEKFLGLESGYRFVSSNSNIEDKPLVRSSIEFTEENKDGKLKRIEFLSLQDLKGSLYFGGRIDKLGYIYYMNGKEGRPIWDVLVIDEAHEGVDTYKTNTAFDNIQRRFTIHLSGTPFKALADDKFATQAIYNWTYADEQEAKANWKGEAENPYQNLPQLNLFTYQMSEIIKDEIAQGINLDGEQEAYAFDLNEFFATKNGKFVHEDSVDKFLDALTTQEKFPFSTPDLRDELKHTFWLLNRVDSAKALAKKLNEHPIFKDYEVILAAGDGKLSEEEENQKSFDKVRKAIDEAGKNGKKDKTITLSVGQLTTGITIPEWTAVLMLSSMKSPALYMQAAFRAQNPYSFNRNGMYFRKEKAYVFDFDPARTLMIFEKFANDLSPETSDGRGTEDQVKENIRTLLNFFPVIGEDENGEMIELDAEKVLSIPRKIRSTEVVNRGFMSDFLFQNISNVFHAPKEVIEIIKQFTPVEEPKNTDVLITPDTEEELSLDENGDVSLSDNFVIGQSQSVFGDKIYDIQEQLQETVEEIKTTRPSQVDPALENLKKEFQTGAVETLIHTAKTEYGRDMTAGDQRRLENKLKKDADKKIETIYGAYQRDTKILETEQKKEEEKATTQKEKEEVKKTFEEKKKKVADDFKQNLTNTVDTFVQDAGEEIVKTVETTKKEKEKQAIQDTVKDHLRGFTRTIPSFLMAYGDEHEPPTLANFHKIVPEAVFKEVTGITLEQFLFLRDGDYYTDETTGELEYFKGHLFDPVVFDDSVKVFMKKKVDLKDYFDEKQKGDIFDYIPPQKTNQIFTPKWVVKKMVDMLEEENPGCFDDPDKTFIDLYMKSGLYAAEIIKRLYQSPKMVELYPNKNARLKHIIENQVYGLAPTEIIYQIATNFVLGFDNTHHISSHNFKKVDALEFAKEGNLEQELEKIYG